jgi:hypothetical protein
MLILWLLKIVGKSHKMKRGRTILVLKNVATMVYAINIYLNHYIRITFLCNI